jgi:hypothetical protein
MFTAKRNSQLEERRRLLQMFLKELLKGECYSHPKLQAFL